MVARGVDEVREGRVGSVSSGGWFGNGNGTVTTCEVLTSMHKQTRRLTIPASDCCRAFPLPRPRASCIAIAAAVTKFPLVGSTSHGRIELLRRSCMLYVCLYVCMYIHYMGWIFICIIYFDLVPTGQTLKDGIESYLVGPCRHWAGCKSEMDPIHAPRLSEHGAG
jgi:hypothetical protein